MVSGPSCQQFRTLFRSSFRLQPKILYLIPEFIFLSCSWAFRTAGFSVFSVFSAFSSFQGSRSGIPVFPFFRFSVSGFQGSKSRIPVFPFFRFLGLQTRNSGVTAPATFCAATFGAHRAIKLIRDMRLRAWKGILVVCSLFSTWHETQCGDFSAWSFRLVFRKKRPRVMEKWMVYAFNCRLPIAITCFDNALITGRRLGPQAWLWGPPQTCSDNVTVLWPKTCCAQHIP